LEVKERSFHIWCNTQILIVKYPVEHDEEKAAFIPEVNSNFRTLSVCLKSKIPLHYKIDWEKKLDEGDYKHLN